MDYFDLVGINDFVVLVVGVMSGFICGVGDNGFIEIILISGVLFFSYLWFIGDIIV